MYLPILIQCCQNKADTDTSIDIGASIVYAVTLFNTGVTHFAYATVVENNYKVYYS